VKLQRLTFTLNWFAVPSIQTTRALPEEEQPHLLKLGAIEPAMLGRSATKGRENVKRREL
jgi:hypothetical protein